MTPQPGDIFVTESQTTVGFLIQAAEILARGFRYTRWTHAGICSRVDDQGVWVVYAEPGGAVEQLWPYANGPHMWSTGLSGLNGGPAAAAAARKYAGQDPDPAKYDPAKRGTPYGWLDYLALTAVKLHLPIPGTREYMASTERMICSQLVDQCFRDAGTELFTDGRPAGDIMPADLADLILAHLIREGSR